MGHTNLNTIDIEMMDLVASYLALDTIMLNETIDLIDNRDNDNELFEQIEELLNDEDIELLEMDQFWDVFHFILNNSSASEPLLNNPLSEVILGCSRADTDECIAIILPEQVDSILNAISTINMDERLLKLDIDALTKADIYPHKWDNIDMNEIKEMLKIIFDDLIVFYKEVKKSNKGILVTIL